MRSKLALWSKQLVRRTIRDTAGLDLVRYRPRPIWPGEADRYSYQHAMVRFGIAAGSTVLDIGSGDHPFPLATVLGDLHVDATPHRARPLTRDDRPLIIMDVCALPFRDKSFDFVYCSHVVEHLNDPLTACRELIRVGRRGYIETPSYATDVLFGWAGKVDHKWHVVNCGNALYFFEYSERERQGVQSTAWFDVMHGDAYHRLQDVFYRNPDLFNVMFLWEGEFDVVVERRKSAIRPTQPKITD